MPKRLSPGYYHTDLLSDILGGGRSSKLHETLVKEKRYMSSANAYITGSIDPGLLVINGKLNKDISYEQVESEIDKIVAQLQTELISDFELEKIKNLAESSSVKWNCSTKLIVWHTLPFLGIRTLSMKKWIRSGLSRHNK